MLERALVVVVLLASAAWADPEMDAMLDGMETLCGERYAGSLDSRDRGHLSCIRAYSAHCALKKGESPREQQALAQSCARVPECPHCPGSERPATTATRCVVEFKRYKRPGPFAETKTNCVRFLIDGMARGGPDIDVSEALIRDDRFILDGHAGEPPDCNRQELFQKYRGYCMCLQREEAKRSLVKREGPQSRKAWEKEYQAALAKAEAAECNLVLTR